MKGGGLILILMLLYNASFSQGKIRTAFPKNIVSLQYAGSTGFATVGIFTASRRDKIELGILYGYMPVVFGGPHHTVSLKAIYNPFQFQLTKRFQLEPLQTGLFICQNFNKNLGLTWGKEYEKGYYWWTRSMRFHFFVSSQLSYEIGTKHFDRIAYYFEANTNDLYVYSYLPNTKTMTIDEIFFFGTGIKMYLQ